MARIYDNLETKFTDGLQGIISNVGVKRVDFCVGYFNLRGWNLIVNEVDQLSGDFVYEQNDRIFRPADSLSACTDQTKTSCEVSIPARNNCPMPSMCRNAE